MTLLTVVSSPILVILSWVDSRWQGFCHETQTVFKICLRARAQRAEISEKFACVWHPVSHISEKFVVYTLVGLLSTVAGHCRPYRIHAHCGGDCALAALPPPTSDMCVAQQICGMGAPTRSPDLALIQCVAQHQRCMRIM